MKKSNLLNLVVILVFSLGCEKSKTITYQQSNSNILALNDGAIISNGGGYYMQAELGKRADLKIVLTNLSSTNAIWFYTIGSDWKVSNYDSGVQEFMIDQKGSHSLSMYFEPGPGSQGGAGSC